MHAKPTVVTAYQLTESESNNKELPGALFDESN